MDDQVAKNAGGKNEGKPHHVIENACRKISVSCLATMLMKINWLKWSRHDVFDYKASY
jgi:hypothetical protein